MSDERLDELIALASLGEVTDAEERELDALLANDPESTADLRSTLDAAAAVQATVAEPPPDALRERVLAATADLPQLQGSEPATDRSPSTDVVSLQSRRRRIGSIVAAVAAAVVLVVAGVVVLTDDRGTDDPVAAVREADDVTVRPLSGELEGLRVLHSRSAGAIVVEGVGVRSPSGDNTFELWLVDEATATPVGLFRPDERGRVERRFDGVDPTGFLLGVTEEPAGGSDTPTLPILASA